MENLYYDPATFGFTTIGEIDWSSGSCEFDLTVVWRRNSDGQLFYGEDSGCSCPQPFEAFDETDLKSCTLASLGEHLQARNVDNYAGQRGLEITALLEKVM